jgi:VanZ family protein
MQPLRFRGYWIIIGYLLTAFVVVASLVKNPPEPVRFQGIDKVEHMLAYFAVTFWFSLIYHRKGARWMIALAFLALGVVLEYVQRLSGLRAFEVADMTADMAGVLCALLAAQTRLAWGLAFVEKYVFRVTP